MARNANDALVGAATAARWKFAHGHLRDVGTDDRKVAGLHLQKIRTGMTSGAECVRSRRNKFSNKHNTKRYYSNVPCQI